MKSFDIFGGNAFRLLKSASYSRRDPSTKGVDTPQKRELMGRLVEPKEAALLLQVFDIPNNGKERRIERVNKVCARTMRL